MQFVVDIIEFEEDIIEYLLDDDKSSDEEDLVLNCLKLLGNKVYITDESQTHKLVHGGTLQALLHCLNRAYDDAHLLYDYNSEELLSKNFSTYLDSEIAWIVSNICI